MKELTAEELKRLEEWNAKEKTVTLTNEEWSTLTTYLLMTTKHREDEARAWADLAEKIEEDVGIKYENAASNAQFWREKIEAIEEIRKKIDEI